MTVRSIADDYANHCFGHLRKSTRAREQAIIRPADEKADALKRFVALAQDAV
jgi:hypothetical protein